MAGGVAFDIVLGLHVASALVAMGGVAATGAYAQLGGAARAKRPDPARVEAARRFFRPGPNWPARVIFLVPAFGLGLVAMDGGFQRFRQVWLAGSAALWLAAAVIAAFLLWPAERRIQVLLAASDPQAAEGPSEELLAASRRASASAAAIDLLLVAAFVLMVTRPGG